MKKKSKIRKLFTAIAYAIIAIIFSIICLGIIFYASGYRFNPKSKRIEKTGMLLIDYKENGLKVFLDKKEITMQMSKTISLASSARYVANVLPGEYDMELKVDGKAAYDEHIVIRPELITQISNLVLLPESIKDEVIASDNFAVYKISPDNKKVAYQKKKGAFGIYDVDARKDSPLDSSVFSNSVEEFNWSQDSRKIILKYKVENIMNYYIYDVFDPSISFHLKDKFSNLPDFENVFFSPKNSNDLLGMLENKLYKINSGPLDKNIVEEGIDFIIQRSENIFYHETKNNVLVELDTAIYAKNILLENFKPAPDFDIFVLNGKNLYIKNEGNLYSIRDKNNLDMIDKEIDEVVISNNKDGLYYTHGYEILDLNSGKTVLRFSKVISNLKEFYKGLYFIYQSGNDLNIISKDGKSDRLIISSKNPFIEIEVLENNKILTILQNPQNTIEFGIIDLGLQQ
ncbi:MAG TPA: hypothetical protein P5096_03980 [Patescibacteria group bacterium]|nr:hypothetical protein [Patescibacteria group bacterium]